MDTILEHAEVIWNLIGIVFTALTSFLITKYTYHRNRPLDKFEIAYDKIYYPINQLLKVENEKLDQQIFAQIDFILKKYHKYADATTIFNFDKYKKVFLENCHSKKSNTAKKIFKNNISEYTIFLRYRLGYLVPNHYKIYKTLSMTDKCIVNIGFGYATIMIIIASFDFFKEIYFIQAILAVIQYVSVIIVICSIGILVISGIGRFILWCCSRVYKVVNWIFLKIKHRNK